MFKADVYADRRSKLRSRLKSGLVLLWGNEESSMNYRDNPYPFRQDSTFLYYTGLNHPGLSLLMDLDEGTDTVFGDDYTIDDIVWMGPQPTIRERSRAGGISSTRPAKDLGTIISQARKGNRRLRMLPAYRPEHTVKGASIMGVPISGVARGVCPDLIKAVADQRNIKTQDEIQEIEKAVNLSADMHIRAYRMVRPGLTEARVAAAVHETALSGGGALSFPIIATIHGETLHNHYHGNTLKEGDLFLLDAGAETPMGYAGDLSSTMPVSGRFTSRQKEIYQVALNAHEAAIQALKPGVPFRDIHLLACKTIVSGMKELGFMKGDEDEAVSRGIHALFFPCGLGHMMGLDVHDMENLGEEIVGYGGEAKSTQFGLKSLRLARPLEPGFVLTIEPGIYFIPQLIDQWKQDPLKREFVNFDRVEAYRDFGGLRNEEDFVITETGARRLGKPIPKTVDEVETLMAEAH